MAYEATLSLPGICFTHYRTGKQAEDEAALMAVILADAMNAGAERMAQSSRDVTIHRMMVMVERHLRAAIYASTTSARYRYAQRPLTFT